MSLSQIPCDQCEENLGETVSDWRYIGYLPDGTNLLLCNRCGLFVESKTMILEQPDDSGVEK